MNVGRDVRGMLGNQGRSSVKDDGRGMARGRKKKSRGGGRRKVVVVVVLVFVLTMRR